jgi:hypothetical protein
VPVARTPGAILVNLLALTALLVLAELLPRVAGSHDLQAALANARAITGLEASLGLYVEPQLAGWVAERPWLARGLNVLYVGLHVPVLAGVLVWLYLRHPRHLRWARATFAGTMALTIAGYVLLPTAPPRFLPEVRDTAFLLFGDSATPAGSGAVNTLAAFPSGHVAFAVVAALGARRAMGPSRRRTAWLLYPLAIFVLVVVSAHHFWVDGLAAVAAVGVASAVASGLEARREGRSTLGAWSEPRRAASASSTPSSATAAPASGVAAR